jgi:hypothetical protein
MSFQPNQSILTCTMVNLRASPGFLGETPPAVLALLAERTACIVTGAATTADGLTWWPLRVALADGRILEGWAAERVGEELLLTASGGEPAPAANCFAPTRQPSHATHRTQQPSRLLPPRYRTTTPACGTRSAACSRR